ncbi:hypothetical protein BIW11_02409 [Tropilaelaps mercedesae]|uniref:Uncharacterized protein n=1 Tax=Tropilaelaps mercedesae TaxID=418985 RepID=A0A1V9Y3N3_9ACAR|nr:hypothetical protein BIW11_02409 [Tropilaelaps mercedesae]
MGHKEYTKAAQCRKGASNNWKLNCMNTGVVKVKERRLRLKWSKLFFWPSRIHSAKAWEFMDFATSRKEATKIETENKY